MFPQKLLFALLLFFCFSHTVLAVTPEERLSDPKLEERARLLSRDLRCPVCQNQSIDDSNADLSKDLRRLVRERLVAGDSNDQVKEYLQQRYGDYILLTPPVKKSTYILWFAPFLFLIAGGAGYYVFLRRRAQTPPQDIAAAEDLLSDAEQKALAEFLSSDAQSDKKR